MDTVYAKAPSSLAAIQVQRVAFFQPFTWLAHGAADIARCPGPSLTHGFLMVVLGWTVLIVVGSHPYFVAAALTGFLLIGPIMAVGLCELSRRLQAGQRPDFDDSLAPLLDYRWPLFRFGSVLAAVTAVWFMASEALLRGVLRSPGPSLSETFDQGFLDHLSRVDFVTYGIAGGLLAAVVFLLSVVTVPAILDGNSSMARAMRASFDAVKANPAAMLLWGALITLLIAVGLMTYLIALIVIIPLVGHATWWAYNDLVRR